MTERFVHAMLMRFGEGAIAGDSWWRPDGVCPHYRYPAPSFLSFSRAAAEGSSLWVDRDGTPLIPFTAITWPA
jgi:hypothetical protein